MAEPEPRSQIDFNDTEVAFASKSDSELKTTYRLFKLMSINLLTNLLSGVGLFAVKFNLPFARYLVKQTIYEQFCGGETLLDCQSSIDKLYQNDVLTILDYGAEGKSGEDALDDVKEQMISSVKMAASNTSVPVIVCKITGIAEDDLLIKLGSGKSLDSGEQHAYECMYERIDEICATAKDHGVSVFIDAEESWIQVAIDNIALEMMRKYNQEEVVVYNTYQMYRHDKLAQLKSDYKAIRDQGLFFGAKLVRGAYMDKENTKAKEKGYPTPIHKDKASTDRDYDEAVKFCVERYEHLASCCASHNEKSNLYQAELIESLGIDKEHRHLNFCQLYGMSDHITFNLADAGYNVAKYLVYGPVKEVIPYLVRRAQENTSVTGEMGRELKLIIKEMQRRGLD